MIVVVSPEQAALSWHIFEPLIRRCTDKSNGCYEPIDILKEVLNGDQVMWAAWDKERGAVDAVMTTQVVNLPRRRICKVVWVAGDRMETWVAEFVETIEKYAKEKGCTGGKGFMRRGWLRVWPGAVEEGVCIFRDLTT